MEFSIILNDETSHPDYSTTKECSMIVVYRLHTLATEHATHTHTHTAFNNGRDPSKVSNSVFSNITDITENGQQQAVQSHR